MARKFRLLAGIHMEHVYTPASQEEVDDDRVKTIHRRGQHVKPGKRRYFPGDIIETDADLAAKFGANKFQEIHEQQQAPNPWGDLESLTVPKLRALAELEEIDLGDSTKKPDIIAKLREAMELV